MVHASGSSNSHTNSILEWLGISDSQPAKAWLRVLNILTCPDLVSPRQTHQKLCTLFLKSVVYCRVALLHKVPKWTLITRRISHQKKGSQCNFCMALELKANFGHRKVFLMTTTIHSRAEWGGMKVVKLAKILRPNTYQTKDNNQATARGRWCLSDMDTFVDF